eukprot:NODE_320_length_11094_cov_0.618190.p1 type:complete len:905 gc:universal NODE_320_length_11094_cov_0.618190:6549-3835(-)
MFRKSTSYRPSSESITLVQESWERVRLLEIDENKLILFVLDRQLFKGLDTIGIFTIKFYDNLFYKYPLFREHFKDVTKQAKAFNGIINTIMKKSEFLDENEDKLRELGRKHTEKLKVRPEMYSQLVAVLILTIKEFLKEEFLPVYESSWTSCLLPLIEMMIEGPKKKNKKQRDATFEQIDLMNDTWEKLTKLPLSTNTLNVKGVEQQFVLAMRVLEGKPDIKALLCIKFYDLLFIKEPALKHIFNGFSKQYNLFSDLIDCTLSYSYDYTAHEGIISSIARKYFELYKLKASQSECYIDTLISTFQILLDESFLEDARTCWQSFLKTTFQLLLSDNVKSSNFKPAVKESLSSDELDILHRSWELIKVSKCTEFRFRCIDIRNNYNRLTNVDKSNPDLEKSITNTDLFTLRFYDNLFYDNPSFRVYFPTEVIRRRSFIAMIHAVLFNSEFNPQNIKKFKEVGRIHLMKIKVSVNLMPKFTDSILRTISEFLMERNTEHVQRCWKTAFNIVISMMTDESNKHQRFSIVEVNNGISAEQVQLIRSSWDHLLTKKVSITEIRLRRLDQQLLQSKGDERLSIQTVFCIKFYDNLFWEHSELQPLFSTAELQSAAFTGLMFTLIEKIEFLDQYEDKIRELGKKHAEKYGVKSEYYPYLSNAIISTLKEFLQEEFGVDEINAFKEAFEQISSYMIDGPIKKEKRYSETSSGSNKIKKNKITPIQSSLMLKTWQKLEVKKQDLSRIDFKFLDPELLNESSSPTTVFSLVFYDYLFQEDAKLQAMFPNIFVKSKAFGGMMNVMVKKIEFLDEYEDRIRELGRKHIIEYKTTPEMFNFLKSAVIKSLKFMLQDELDSETLEAWNDGFNIVIDMMLEGPKKKKKFLEEPTLMSQKPSMDSLRSSDRDFKELKDFKP